jgi:outer membrane protein assembly factor BamB
MRSPRRILLPLIASALVTACGGLDVDIPEGFDTPPSAGGNGGRESGEADGSTVGAAAWALPTGGLVSAPVEAGGKIVAYAARHGRLRLIVVDPDTGEVVVRRPSSSSYVTPGVSMAVVVRDDLVYHYRPTGRLQEARIEVYDVRRDRVVGRSGPNYFWSLPTDCPGAGAGAVCVAAGDDDPASVYRVSPASGELRLTAARVGRSIDARLYDASGIITRLGIGGPVWRRSAPALFRGRAVTPDQGWDWQQAGAYLIGSFGTEDSRADGVWVKRAGHTVRVDPSSGRTLWMRSGTAYCELDSMEPAADGPRRWFRCATYGRATGAGSYDRSDWKTTITRFDPRTGEALWTTRPARWDPIYDDGAWVKLSDTLVAGRRGGSLVTLDVDSGRVTKADPEAVGWCMEWRTYRDRDSAARPQTRVARGLATPCTADGDPATAPLFADSAFGTRVGDLFVWSSTTGLRAVHVD